MSAAERVVVTGMGQVSALGVGARPFFERVLRGESGIRTLDGLKPPGLDVPIGGAIPGWRPEEVVPADLARSAWRVTHYAFVAAREAVHQAGLELRDRPRGAVILGTGFGAQGSSEETYRRCFSRPGTRPKPTAILHGMANATAGVLAERFRLLGPNFTVLAACASSNHAIGQAFRMLREGGADLVLAGGADAPLTDVILSAWASLRLLAPADGDAARACRPFHRNRSGIAVSEGAAFLVLETLASARRRDAVVLAEVAGYGASADGSHVTHTDLRGVRRSLRLALEDAGVGPSGVDMVSAHGTATRLNDATEAQALSDVLGPWAAGVPITSTKAVHGHAMGASGALEAVAAIETLRTGLIPPIAHLDEVDPSLPKLDFVRGEARRTHPNVVLSTSFGFGGTNAVLVLRRFP